MATLLPLLLAAATPESSMLDNLRARVVKRLTPDVRDRPGFGDPAKAEPAALMAMYLTGEAAAAETARLREKRKGRKG